MPAATITFLRRGQTIRHKPDSPTQTVLDYLRLSQREKGTKEGCNEGDCGACTVVVGRARDGKVHYQAVNSCIMLVGQLQGCELITVDDLSSGADLHPLQQAFVENHASQCGFCTPGFVMSAFALLHTKQNASRKDVVDQFAGNLCRCTGYRPIIAATLEASAKADADVWSKNAAEIAAELKKIDTGEDIFCGNTDSFLALPAQEDTLLELAAKHSDATLVAGGTDVGLWITKQLRSLPKIIMTGRVKALRNVADRVATLSLGGAVTYEDAAAQISALSPDIAEVLRRIGSKQVRALGTIGGNIANGSPIGDMPPILIALGTRITLRKQGDSRDLPLEKFFIDYGKQDRKPGEILWRIDIPKLRSSERFFAHKLSKRFDQDISAVMVAMKFVIDGRKIATATLAFGGMAATPRRASRTEEAFRGLKLDDAVAWEKAIAQLAEDFAPITDMRASASYRLTAAQGLLHKALLELSGQNPGTLRVLPPTGKEAWL
jgi:xanthine dehydrogenase small subunit